MNVPAHHITVHGIFVFTKNHELLESKDHVFGNSVSLSPSAITFVDSSAKVGPFYRLQMDVYVKLVFILSAVTISSGENTESSELLTLRSRISYLYVK